MWADWRPHLILMDLHMPVMDGLEAGGRIKSHPEGRETVIIALTADVMCDPRRIILERKADDFLSKPCPEGELLERIASHLGLTYVFEKETKVGGFGADPATTSVACNGEQLTEVPKDLLLELRDATISGDKAL